MKNSKVTQVMVQSTDSERLTIEDIKPFVIAALLGVMAVAVPAMLDPKMKHYDSPLFPLIRSGVEGLSIQALAWLIVAGFIAGWMSSLAPWKLGMATMALFPLFTIAEMIVEPSSHNLFPLEFMMYGVLSGPGTLGAFFAREIKNKYLAPRL